MMQMQLLIREDWKSVLQSSVSGVAQHLYSGEKVELLLHDQERLCAEIFCSSVDTLQTLEQEIKWFVHNMAKMVQQRWLRDSVISQWTDLGLVYTRALTLKRSDHCAVHTT